MNIKLTNATEGKVGEYRKFSFSDKIYRIEEVLDSPNISMMWKWDTGLCPYCKKRIVREIKHDFYRIEILVDKDKKNPTIDDIEIIGDTLDRRKMRIPKDRDEFKMALLKSKYKHLLKKII